MRIAITRSVSPRIAECQLSYLQRQPIDFDRAVLQHATYERSLAAHGCTIVHAVATPDMPDSVFVEDTAVVLDDVAIITRPGAESRRPETTSVAEVVRHYRPLRYIEPPATLDGGDVLVVDQKLYVGTSQRTNAAAVEQLLEIPRPAKRGEGGSSDLLPRVAGAKADDVVPIQFRNCLHLKSAVTAIDGQTLLLNPDYVDRAQFRGFECIDVDPSEPHAANILRLDDGLIYSASYPRTRRRLESRGFQIDVVDMSQLEKAEAGVTCCSLIFDVLASVDP
ncbi:MAG TPA: arginine deiminase family protein [Thermoanaerobaculia bacterium]|nr:arginine deiminase family protein [Thermoanaerobaculia bacterium]